MYTHTPDEARPLPGTVRDDWATGIQFMEDRCLDTDAHETHSFSHSSSTHCMTTSLHILDPDGPTTPRYREPSYVTPVNIAEGSRSGYCAPIIAHRLFGPTDTDHRSSRSKRGQIITGFR